ncbi:S1C family serine protease [Thalassospiraceae bacterium LMO-JJ14]|nr:S1C family serine protease [Thalassospiraceae bacterium LMO-JJ14]
MAKDSYTLFFDQKDHLKELTAAGNFADASILYEEQREYFDSKAKDDPELSSEISNVVKNVSTVFESDISETMADLDTFSWPADPSNWDSARLKLQTAERILAIIPTDGVFVNPSYQPEGLVALKTKVAALRKQVDSSTATDFIAYDHFSGEPFFAVHPGSFSAKEFFVENPTALPAVLKGRSSAEISKFADQLGQDNVAGDDWQTISRAYVNARLEELPKKNRKLADVLSIVSAAKSAGYEVQKLDSVKVGFVEVTSRTLLNQGQIEFPASIEVDLPFDIEKSELDTAFESSTANNADYLVVFDVALAKVRRKIGKMSGRSSKRIVGYKQESNPKYTQLQNQVTATQMRVQTEAMNVNMAQSQYCYGLGCMGKIIAVAAADAKRQEAQNELQNIMGQLSSTPTMIEVPVKAAYQYRVANVDASKTMTVHYYVIDKANKRYFKSTFDITENERFEVAYGISETDPDAKNLAGKQDDEADVADWEKAPSSVKLSQLVDHYLANQSKSKRMTNITALRKEMLEDRNTAIAKYKENTFEESTANDPRFDSVVAIYTGTSLGSGFFVRPDIVMTNYHVVDEGEFVELKMHDEQETFGKVIARDAVLDLALIKVQSRGKPVRFFNKNKIELGSTVEVIGHPKGYEFSITRGVVSAIRKSKSVNLAAGSDVLFVQIDAATSPGNSGGPVFLDDYVISVVSWGDARQGSENLNFTVHHSEAQRFLNENLGGS